MTYRDQTPQIVSVLLRKLKHGKTFDDFQQAHLPPGKTVKRELGYDVDYFKAPTRVINAVSVEDPTMIVSIGLTYGEPGAVLEEVMSKLPIEKERHDKIAKVADKMDKSFIAFVASDNNYGASNPAYTQLPLFPVTPEVTAAMKSIGDKPPK